jgi:hypothetical protein
MKRRELRFSAQAVTDMAVSSARETCCFSSARKGVTVMRAVGYLGRDVLPGIPHELNRRK